MTNVLRRFEETIRTGRLARRRLTPAGLGKISGAQRWLEAMRIVLQVSDVHSDAQRQFLDTWMRVGGAYIRNKVADDDLFFAALRRLLPTYDGPPRTLFRGQRVSHPIGMSWTRSFQLLRVSYQKRCPPSGVKRTSKFKSVTSAFDPKRTLHATV